MSQLLIELPEENVELLMALLPKLNGRLISRSSSTYIQPQVNTVDIIEPLVNYDGQYFYDTFELTESRYEELTVKYPNSVNKNNRDVGQMATEIVADYLMLKIPDAKIRAGSKGADLELVYNGTVEPFEIKGTTANTISWPKIKVSSQACYNGLMKGMRLIRVLNADTRFPKLYFLKFGRDFIMRPEDRWSVHPVKPVSPNE